MGGSYGILMVWPISVCTSTTSSGYGILIMGRLRDYRGTYHSHSALYINTMNNAAFRKLVTERSTPKSTKEIAREAVEEEFHEKGGKRRRRVDGYDSDSDDNTNNKTDKKGKHFNPTTSTAGHDEPVLKSKKVKHSNDLLYRDRAKERREGIDPQEYESSNKLLQDIQQAAEEGETDAATLSKYLGGDEAHTHLVKGLDVALARKVKRDMGNAFAKQQMRLPLNVTTNTDDLDTLLQQGQTNKLESKPNFAKNATEAKEFVHSSWKPSTPLGASILAHLQSKYRLLRENERSPAFGSPSGLLIQRSSTIFSFFPNLHNALTAWEIPQELTHAKVEHDSRISGVNAQGALVLDLQLIQKIKNALAPLPQTATKITPSSSNKPAASVKPCSDTDEDDIFVDAGDYIPPGSSSGMSMNQVSSQKEISKGSIFANLSTERQDISHNMPHVPFHDYNSKTGVPQHTNSVVIDRDILGARPPKTRLSSIKQGVGITSYQGDYGEELDTDFTGRDDEDDEDTSPKKIKLAIPPSRMLQMFSRENEGNPSYHHS